MFSYFSFFLIKDIGRCKDWIINSENILLQNIDLEITKKQMSANFGEIYYILRT